MSCTTVQFRLGRTYGAAPQYSHGFQRSKQQLTLNNPRNNRLRSLPRKNYQPPPRKTIIAVFLTPSLKRRRGGLFGLASAWRSKRIAGPEKFRTGFFYPFAESAKYFLSSDAFATVEAVNALQ